MSSKTPPLAVVDTETTGLDRFLHDAWEIAAIVRADGYEDEYVFRIEPDLTNADSKALEINRYHERTTAPDWRWDDRQTAATRLYSLLNGAVILGSNPAFDADMIGNLFGRYYADPRPWHYRVIDVPAMAAGWLYGANEHFTYSGPVDLAETVALPWKSYHLSEALGVAPPAEKERHTALADARWQVALYDAVVARRGQERAA
ncbi:3'-5' exonuclease [Streptomyces phytophilus]|uniref:3'-5' exonuclease n=1 Tax=Streptomyces phytophilus TaxID=722715 RepID=UPI0015F06284|nr:3'-5' exonuclease [Streptomyces phytophilus]